jgi:hypothetical protein
MHGALDSILSNRPVLKRLGISTSAYARSDNSKPFKLYQYHGTEACSNQRQALDGMSNLLADSELGKDCPIHRSAVPIANDCGIKH